MPSFGQAMTVFVGGQRCLRDHQQFAVGRKREIGIGDFGHQADVHAIAGFVAGKEAMQGGVTEAAHAAEQIQLECGQAHARGVQLGHRRIAAGAFQLSVDTQPRQAVRALDAVHPARALHVERGHAQVAIVGQRGLDQGCQLRVGEELTPADIGDHVVRCLARHLLRPLRGDLRAGRGQCRLQGGAAADEQHAGDGERCQHRPVQELSHWNFLLRSRQPWPCRGRRTCVGSPRRTAG